MHAAARKPRSSLAACRARIGAGAAPSCERGRPPKHWDCNAEIQPLLRDCDYANWRGRTLDDLQAREPDAVAAWLGDPAATPHGGESLLALMERVATWLDGEQTDHQRSIVVTHAAIIRAAIVHAIEATPQSFWRIDVAPLSCTRLSGNGGRWNLISAGRTSTATEGDPTGGSHFR